MSLPNVIDNVTSFISEAIVRIFGPTDDQYPVIGVQPFEGEPSKNSRKADW